MLRAPGPRQQVRRGGDGALVLSNRHCPQLRSLTFLFLSFWRVHVVSRLPCSRSSRRRGHPRCLFIALSIYPRPIVSLEPIILAIFACLLAVIWDTHHIVYLRTVPFAIFGAFNP